jgi:hypothetical protein
MANTTVIKVDSKFSPTGPIGQKYLASGLHIAMRLWENEPPGEPKAATQRAYGIVGYVIKGRAQLSGASAKSIVEYGASAEEVPHGVTYWPYDC